MVEEGNWELKSTLHNCTHVKLGKFVNGAVKQNGLMVLSVV